MSNVKQYKKLSCAFVNSLFDQSQRSSFLTNLVLTVIIRPSPETTKNPLHLGQAMIGFSLSFQIECEINYVELVTTLYPQLRQESNQTSLSMDSTIDHQMGIFHFSSVLYKLYLCTCQNDENGQWCYEYHPLGTMIRPKR